ncbi:MAG TPA: MFS transporter [Gammaproteobacteria bacterium]|nr:MFS transporter [Gammaproteobacteria bacterium]
MGKSNNKFLPRTVIILGMVSFLNDAASDMILPILPLYLTAVLGAGPAAVGLIEGVAEASASLLKLISGRMADKGWYAKGLVISGYSFSNVVRPLMAITIGWWWVLLMRFCDRIGKGLRTSPRDSLISSSVAPEQRGRAFGLHRAMDNAGAVVGPLLAFWLLQQQYSMSQVIAWSVVPGIFVILLLWFGLDSNLTINTSDKPIPPLQWSLLDKTIQRLIIAVTILAFASVPEAFLVLWVHDAGLAILWVPLLWAGASALKMIVAYPAGKLSDSIGRNKVLLVGWSARLAILILLGITAHTTSMPWIIVLFILYGGILAITEGAERALIGDFAKPGQQGTAFGIYHMFTGIAVLPGALLLGWVWQIWGSQVAFFIAASLVFIVVIVLNQMIGKTAPPMPI